MSEQEKNVGTQQDPKEEPKTTDFVVQEGKAKKAVKWLIRGLVVLATGALGFFAGRASVGEDNEETEETTEETKE